MAELTPYDTGEVLEPKPWHVQPLNLPDPEEKARYGRVDFDNDEGATVLTAHIGKNTDPGLPGYTLNLSNVNAALAVTIDDSAPLLKVPSQELRDSVERVVSGLRTQIEQDEAEIFWSDHQALVLVPGEKHVRKQQLILVSENTEDLSAIVKNWGVGVRDTRID